MGLVRESDPGRGLFRALVLVAGVLSFVAMATNGSRRWDALYLVFDLLVLVIGTFRSATRADRPRRPQQ
jgi:hypothetical protein